MCGASRWYFGVGDLSGFRWESRGNSGWVGRVDLCRFLSGFWLGFCEWGGWICVDFCRVFGEWIGRSVQKWPPSTPIWTNILNPGRRRSGSRLTVQLIWFIYHTSIALNATKTWLKMCTTRTYTCSTEGGDQGCEASDTGRDYHYNEIAKHRIHRFTHQ